MCIRHASDRLYVQHSPHDSSTAFSSSISDFSILALPMFVQRPRSAQRRLADIVLSAHYHVSLEQEIGLRVVESCALACLLRCVGCCSWWMEWTCRMPGWLVDGGVGMINNDTNLMLCWLMTVSRFGCFSRMGNINHIFGCNVS